MANDVRLFQATNENACCGFEARETQEDVWIVTAAAPLIYNRVIAKRVEHAILELKYKGWRVEELAT